MLRSSRSRSSKPTHISQEDKALLTTPRSKFRNHLSKRNFKFDEEAQRFSGNFASVVILQKSETTPPTPKTPSQEVFDNREDPLKTPSKISFLSPTIAIKTQAIVEPKNIDEAAYRELKILKALARLKRSGKCANFVEIHDHFKTTGDENLNEDPNQHYMNYMLERGDTNLQTFLTKEIPLDTFKSILFQIIFGLHIAQRELEFQHNDLHNKNILIKHIGKKNIDGCLFYHHNTKWTSKTGFLVKLTDFGHSRIKSPNGLVVHNRKIAVSAIFDPSKDLSDVKKNIARVNVNYEGHDEADERSRLNSLRNCMSKQEPSQLLYHSFFQSMVHDKDLTQQERARLLHFDRGIEDEEDEDEFLTKPSLQPNLILTSEPAQEAQIPSTNIFNVNNGDNKENDNPAEYTGTTLVRKRRRIIAPLVDKSQISDTVSECTPSKRRRLVKL
ncbi:serine/threonine protein kinase [Acrasis kona]|uniref:Serine/threonine protein kinase n=1 Tax=Acrasis kona TaxID=1008807 RepID=A0AAW2ZH05_9EUKA